MDNKICTVPELFSTIIGELQKTIDLKTMGIEYGLPEKRYEETQITNVEFDVSFVVKRESSNIYCDMYLIGDIGNGNIVNILFGWFKTNLRDDESLKTMSSIGGEFVIATDRVITNNMDYLNRTGFKIDVYNGSKKIYGFYCNEKENIPTECKVRIEGKTLTKAIITDNMTKETKEYQIALFTDD